MNNYKLYINSQLVDMNDGESILFQKQRTDYTNPTIVKNSFTKTIKLPDSKNNNKIFNDIWKLDRVQFTNSFNASKRTPFILLKDGNLVEKGYAKLDKIVWNGDHFNYEMTLYGELGNLLYSLKYKTDPDTEETTEMNLGDLSYGFTRFTISKNLIISGWNRLGGDTEESENFDTINFMVSYDGIPDCENFDPKKCWCSVERNAAVNWDGTNYAYNNFPKTKTVDGKTYTFINTMISRMDPNDHYGLLELKKDMSPLEARDLRCYLLRPVLRIQKIFAAINNYLLNTLDYTLDLSDPFFSTDEFTKTWLTLSMLYETDPNIESFKTVTKETLMSNTSSPADYLISYCKIYGIYMDVDMTNKKLVLTRLPNFFTDIINELKIDKSKEIKIIPLSFDKATYTFDMGEGEGEFLKYYKDTYNYQYGSKKVNTGYKFDASSSPYIDNNIFREGVDSLDQSIYYRYPAAVRASTFICYPQALTEPANLPTFKLFNSQDTSDTYGTEMSVIPTMTISSTLYTINNSGYQFMDERWMGIKTGVWQDGFPKLQFHKEDNKAADGKDVLVKFNGMKQTQYGSNASSTGRDAFVRDTMEYYDYVHYLVSDDHEGLKQIIGTNCYYDNPVPAFGFGWSYIQQVDTLPSFTRCEYDLSINISETPVMMTSVYSRYNILGSENTVSITKSNDNFHTTFN